jgi:hypothetical protein
MCDERECGGSWQIVLGQPNGVECILSLCREESCHYREHQALGEDVVSGSVSRRRQGHEGGREAAPIRGVGRLGFGGRTTDFISITHRISANRSRDRWSLEKDTFVSCVQTKYSANYCTSN